MTVTDKRQLCPYCKDGDVDKMKPECAFYVSGQHYIIGEKTNEV